MGNTPENNKNAGGKRTPPCRVAYSLNNTQPVECTIISDQPFFYMDEDIGYEDDALLSAEDVALYESLDIEIGELKSKIDTYDRLSLEFTQPRDKVLQDFIVEGKALEKAADIHSSEINYDELVSIIAESRYASALFKIAKDNQISVKLSDQIEKSIYDKDEKEIVINPSLSLERAVFAFVKELRRHWQHINGTLLHPMAFHPDHAVLINRAQIADLATAIIRTAWELKLSGHKAYWSEIENSSLSDLGRSFAREALMDFRTLNSGKASSAVFETWFLSERCGQEDKKLIQMMLSDYEGYQFEHTEASRLVSIDLICQLGEQPFGKNYLAPYAQMILNDPVFTDVRDRSNANFLWFIKFERSFNEAEQELQASSIDQTRDVHHAFFNNEDNPENREQEEDTRYGTNVINIDFAGIRSHKNEKQS